MHSIVSKLQYGISALATKKRAGYPILRMNNLQQEGWDLSDLKYIGLTNSEAETYRLRKGDIIFNRTNSKELVGKCEVFRQDGHWVFASYLIRVRLDESKALPDFVSTYLNTIAGRTQIDQLSRQIVGMSNINAEEIKQLLIPLPTLEIQRGLLAEIQAAREERKRKLQRADTLLVSLDSFLLGQLDLLVEEQEYPPFFAVRLTDIWSRADTDFHSPRFKQLRHAIERCQLPVLTVRDCCKDIKSGFAAGREVQAFDEISGIPHIRPLNISQFGELSFNGTKYVPRESVPNTEIIKIGEVLFNNTNSEEWVGKSTVFEEERTCCCSNHITRLVVDSEKVDARFIAALMNAIRSTGYLGMLATKFVNQAGINTDTLSRLTVPIPTLEKQQEIAIEITKRREEARRLREEAARQWQTAKQRFEEALLF